MLGHTLWQVCRDRVQTHVTVRAASAPSAGMGPEYATQIVTGVRAEAPETVAQALDAVQPEVAVNCIGVVPQAEAAGDAAWLFRVNALFPHELAAACQARGVRLIHISTDCVFSGRGGGYTEDDIPDPVAPYGRSKLAGEPWGPRVLTLRTSMIGWELGGRSQGLLEWFVSQRGGTVSGYTHAVFSGPTAPVLSRAILATIQGHPDLEGAWHIAAEPIAKHDLLQAIRAALDLNVEIVPNGSVRIDRSLDASRFAAATGWAAPPWQEMVLELAGSASANPVGQSVAGR